MDAGAAAGSEALHIRGASATRPPRSRNVSTAASMRAGSGRGEDAGTARGACARAPSESASRTARSTATHTVRGSAKRTSVFAGWTLTSTRWRGISRKRKASPRNSPAPAPRYASATALATARSRVEAAAVMDLHLRPAGGALLARAQSELRDAGDGRQGLTPEAVGGDGVQVRQRAELRGGVAVEGALGILGRHAFAVVAHAD